jgi:hypothetical protein
VLRLCAIDDWEAQVPHSRIFILRGRSAYVLIVHQHLCMALTKAIGSGLCRWCRRCGPCWASV